MITRGVSALAAIIVGAWVARGAPTDSLYFLSGRRWFVHAYDDDGVSLSYQRNIATWTRFRWDASVGVLTMEPDS